MLALVIVNSVMIACLFVIVNRWINAQLAHTRDVNRPVTPGLVKIWKQRIKEHAKGSETYESYKASLIKANKFDGD